MNPSPRRQASTLQRWTLAAFACLGLAAVAPAGAQPSDLDPPARVGRVGETSGQVWLYSPDAAEWIGAVRNRPVTSGDRLATDAGARVEVNLGSTTVRLDGGSELEVRRLDDAQVSLHLLNGSAALRVRDAQAVGELDVTTDDGRLRFDRPGRYRVDRFGRSTDLTVSSGQAVYEGPGSALTVEAGQRGEFWIESNGAAQYSLTEPMRDAFAGWVDTRDRDEDRLAANRFVSPEMTGAQDLDRYGRWEQSPEYGALWFPRSVPSGWAPYSTGRWTWVRPWGWTWVDDAPWGFAPFHYGRWVNVRNTWGWAPGTYVRRPVYAPALVAWVGGSGGNASVTVGGGPAVGWFPLGPREAYVPGYRYSPRYLREINTTHVRNFDGRPYGERHEFINRGYPGAVTVVPSSVLVNREPVGPNAARYRDSASARAVLAEPGRVAAMMAAPIAAPSRDGRGVDARPFRRPDTEPFDRRGPRTAANAPDDTRRGAPDRPSLNASEEARRGPVAVPPPFTEDRRRDDRRGGVAVPQGVQPRGYDRRADGQPGYERRIDGQAGYERRSDAAPGYERRGDVQPGYAGRPVAPAESPRAPMSASEEARQGRPAVDESRPAAPMSQARQSRPELVAPRQAPPQPVAPQQAVVPQPVAPQGGGSDDRGRGRGRGEGPSPGFGGAAPAARPEAARPAAVQAPTPVAPAPVQVAPRPVAPPQVVRPAEPPPAARSAADEARTSEAPGRPGGRGSDRP